MIERTLEDEVAERVFRMRRLAREYREGRLAREAFVEAMLAFEWNPSRQTLPPEIRGANLSEVTAWRLRQIGKMVIPDSPDELSLMFTLGLIDKDVRLEIYDRWYEQKNSRRDQG